jgi:DNA-binding MarR family transcriptional regulator
MKSLSEFGNVTQAVNSMNRHQLSVLSFLIHNPLSTPPEIIHGCGIDFGAADMAIIELYDAGYIEPKGNREQLPLYSLAEYLPLGKVMDRLKRAVPLPSDRSAL